MALKHNDGWFHNSITCPKCNKPMILVAHFSMYKCEHCGHTQPRY